VSFIDPVNIHVLSDRAIKCGLVRAALNPLFLLLFAALAAVLVATRRVDWFASFGNVQRAEG
jgi:inner membrane protein involved in colicin E2 resistance